jgi:hypothetical protein
LGQQFDQIVAREARGFLPVVKRLPVAIAEGSGSRVRDVEGNELIDLTAGWGVCAIGHCHPRLVAAISEQAGRLMQTTNLFYTLPQLDLIEKLRAIAPGTKERAGAPSTPQRPRSRTRNQPHTPAPETLARGPAAVEPGRMLVPIRPRVKYVWTTVLIH